MTECKFRQLIEFNRGNIVLLQQNSLSFRNFVARMQKSFDNVVRNCQGTFLGDWVRSKDIGPVRRTTELQELCLGVLALEA